MSNTTEEAVLNERSNYTIMSFQSAGVRMTLEETPKGDYVIVKTVLKTNQSYVFAQLSVADDAAYVFKNYIYGEITKWGDDT